MLQARNAPTAAMINQVWMPMGLGTTALWGVLSSCANAELSHRIQRAVQQAERNRN